MNVPLSGPTITKLEKNYVLDVLNCGILSMGKYTDMFENKMKDFANRQYAIAVSSGTAGLFLALKYYNLSSNDEIITTPFSFISSANVIIHSGANVVFVDIDRETMCISIKYIIDFINNNYRYQDNKLINIHNGKILRGFLIVDIFGSMPDYEQLIELINKYDLFLIEDSCEALGSDYKNKKAGSFGDVSVFAFYPNKQITTGEGGMVLTDNKYIYEFIKAMKNQGRRDMDLWLKHYYLGYNFRIDEMSSALGVAQMERLDYILEKRNEKAHYYINAFNKNNNIKCFRGNKFGKTGWFVFIIQVKSDIREQLMDFLINNRIGVRPYFSPIHLQKPYIDNFGFKEGDFKETENISKSTIAIPFFTNITKQQQDYVINKIEEFFHDRT